MRSLIARRIGLMRSELSASRILTGTMGIPSGTAPDAALLEAAGAGRDAGALGAAAGAAAR